MIALGVDPEEHDESSDDDFGPALPPHLANRNHIFEPLFFFYKT